MKEVKLTRGYVALVDDEDFERVSQHTWHVKHDHRNVYACTNIVCDGKRVYVRLHRFIVGIYDPEIEVDHEDHNGLNCQKHNIRKANSEQNAYNMRSSQDEYLWIQRCDTEQLSS